MARPAVKDFVFGFRAGVKAAARGTKVLVGPRRGQVELSVADGAAGLGRISPKVTASLRRALEGVRRRIVAGEIRIPGAPRR